MLIAAATEAFAEHGADDVSLEEIARRAGVGIGTLYRHFPARQAAARGGLQGPGRRARCPGRQAADVAESPADALAEWLRAFVAFGRTKRSLSAALVATLGKDSELMSSCSTMLRRCTDSLLARAQEAGEVRPEVQSADIFRLTHGLIMATETAPSDPGQPERLIGLIIDSVLLPGVAGAGTGS